MVQTQDLWGGANFGPGAPIWTNLVTATHQILSLWAYLHFISTEDFVETFN